jgi:hypothetical protein
MIEYSRGIKAGLIAGIVWGAIVAIVLATLLTVYKSDVLSSISTTPQVNMTTDQLYTITLEFGSGAAVGTGIIGGIILGAIFAAVYRLYMKGSSIATRGLVFGIVLFLIDLVINFNGGEGSGMDYFTILILGYLGASLVFGYLLGYLFERFKPSTPRVQGSQDTSYYVESR